MTILLDNQRGDPIYRQIAEQIKAQILSGALQTDTALPSIRNLAKDLRISVITTKRAYDELEQEGFVYTIAGKGCFVAPLNLKLVKEENLKKIESHLQEAARLATACQLSGEELLTMLRILLQEE